MSWLLFTALTACNPKGDPQPVRVEFTARATTFVGEPFGLTYSEHYLAPAAGFFLYDASEGDSENEDTWGVYTHSNSGGFELEIEGILIEGSDDPRVEVQNYDPDSFIFKDGPGSFGDQAGVMSVDGASDEHLDLHIQITDADGSAFADDALPTVFPFSDADLEEALTLAHTFTLKGREHDLFLELLSVTPVE